MQELRSKRSDFEIPPGQNRVWIKIKQAFLREEKNREAGSGVEFRAVSRTAEPSEAAGQSLEIEWKCRAVRRYLAVVLVVPRKNLPRGLARTIPETVPTESWAALEFKKHRKHLNEPPAVSP